MSDVGLVGQQGDSQEDIDVQNDSSSDFSNTKSSPQDMFNAAVAWLDRGPESWQDIALILVVSIAITATVFAVGGVLGGLLSYMFNITEHDNNSVSGGNNISNAAILTTITQPPAAPTTTTEIFFASHIEDAKGFNGDDK